MMLVIVVVVVVAVAVAVAVGSSPCNFNSVMLAWSECIQPEKASIRKQPN